MKGKVGGALENQGVASQLHQVETSGTFSAPVLVKGKPEDEKHSSAVGQARKQNLGSRLGLLECIVVSE